MRCLLCLQENGLTIRGRCVECAPSLHIVRAEQSRIMADLENRYRQETGKGSLENWGEFEKFLETKLTLEQQDGIEKAFLGPCLW